MQICLRARARCCDACAGVSLSISGRVRLVHCVTDDATTHASHLAIPPAPLHMQVSYACVLLDAAVVAIALAASRCSLYIVRQCVRLVSERRAFVIRYNHTTGTVDVYCMRHRNDNDKRMHSTHDWYVLARGISGKSGGQARRRRIAHSNGQRVDTRSALLCWRV